MGLSRNSASSRANVCHRYINNNGENYKQWEATENTCLPRETDTGTSTRWIQGTPQTIIYKIWHRFPR